MVTDKPKKKEEDFELPESQKYKLTLGIDREVVRRAKIEDINISFWTEQLLKIMTFRPEEIQTSNEDVLQIWYRFLSEIKKILEKYKIETVILGEITMHAYKTGKVIGYLRTFLDSYGHVYTAEYDINGNYIEIDREEAGPAIASSDLDKEIIKHCLRNELFHKPTQILENILYEITQSSKINKAKVREMQVALRVLKLMSENGV